MEQGEDTKALTLKIVDGEQFSYQCTADSSISSNRSRRLGTAKATTKAEDSERQTVTAITVIDDSSQLRAAHKELRAGVTARSLSSEGKIQAAEEIHTKQKRDDRRNSASPQTTRGILKLI